MPPTTNEAASTGRFSDARDTDIVIPIIGLGGAGKSTFVNYLLQGANCSEKAVLVGHDQDPCTTQPQYVVLDSSCRPELKYFGDRRLIFVDTPGLDGTDPVGNNQVIGDIVKWFKSSYGCRISFRGVVYLQDISEARSPQLAKNMVERLWEISRDPKMTAKELKERTLLVTTKWSRAAQGNCHKEDFEKTENILKKHWKPMEDAGAQIQRLEAGSEEKSAWQIIRSMLEKADHEPSARASKPWNLEDARETDIVILIMGPTGAGKSSFINRFLSFLGDPRRVKVGDDLVSCTSQPESIVFDCLTDHWKRIKGHRIVVVDTPGFDDTYVDDFEVLKRISKWLEQSYRTSTVIGGVIYLHDISQEKFSGTARRNLEVFKRLCGEPSLDKVALVTAKWGRAFGRNLETREDELKTKHWKTMLDGGAKVERLDADHEEEATWKIVRYILDKAEKRAIEQVKSEGLEIQRELVQRHKLVPQTQAGRELRHQLEEMLQAQRQMLEWEGDAISGDANAKAQLDEAEKKVELMTQQIQNMKVSLPERVSRWVKLFKR
ncbi:hypothetical protein EST38_g13143 [Candolleomyces aberdarensis]|uniref:G domain-containing protein n=1 Tax=Candolleomyces aberdarensis TaxID=2316362 RepID=A0A4Q2D1T6_9AGAR|nr:hypothetical protein EST38_g13143 [Candolleomyces aberdarensis]